MLAKSIIFGIYTCTFFEVTYSDNKVFVAVNLSDKNPVPGINIDPGLTDKQIRTFLQEHSLKHYGNDAEIEIINKE